MARSRPACRPSTRCSAAARPRWSARTWAAPAATPTPPAHSPPCVSGSASCWAGPAGPSAQAAVASLRPGSVVMLENLRFNAGETSKDDTQRGAFADQLAALADLYVGDACGTVHRRHASVYDVPARLPHAAGYLVREETAALQ